MVIPQKLPPETIALIDATARQVEDRRAAIMFRAWHRLETEQARRLLFAQFTFDGHVVGLLDAIIASVGKAAESRMVPFPPIPLDREDRASRDAMLESALAGALGEVLNASAQVLDAWCAAFRFFMRRLVPVPEL